MNPKLTVISLSPLKNEKYTHRKTEIKIQTPIKESKSNFHKSVLDQTFLVCFGDRTTTYAEWRAQVMSLYMTEEQNLETSNLQFPNTNNSQRVKPNNNQQLWSHHG